MFNPSRIGSPLAPEPARPATPQPAPPSQTMAGQRPAEQMQVDRLSVATPAQSKRAPGQNLVLNLGLEATAPADWGNVSIPERQTNLQQLKALAQQLQARGTPGVALWSQLTQAAIDAYAGKQLSPARKSDFVMQDLAVVVVGGDAFKHLQSYQGLPWVRHPDPLVETFFADWAALGLPPANQDWKAAGWAGGDLDTHHTADFRPEIADGSDNQIYHTLFYEFMAYTTQAPFTIHGGSIVHEFKDVGTSSEDHNACLAAVTTGLALRRQRDSQVADVWLQDWPAITRAAYSKDGGPDIQAGTAGPRARSTDQAIRELLDHKPLLWKAENAVIDGVKHIKSARDKIRQLWR